MTERPKIGARVRVLSNTGIPGLAGKTGRVMRHHADGIAVIVRMDEVQHLAEEYVCDPVNVRPERDR